MTENTAFNFDDVVFACTHLCDLLEVENEALAAHDTDTVRELADNKAALARFYDNAMEPLRADPSVLAELSPEQQDDLKALGLRLHELTATNARRLQAEMAACQTVMDVVVDAVKKNSTKGPTYGRDGHFGAAGGQDASISFNKTL